MIREEDMFNPLKFYLQKKGYNVYKEIPFLSKRIDVVGTKKDRVVAVEMKVKNWKKAQQQAMLYRLCAHKVYIALWHEFAHRAKLGAFAKYGIGLMKVNGSVEILNEADKSGCIHESQLKKVLEEIKRRSDGGDSYFL